MTIKTVLKEQIQKINPNEKELKYLQGITNQFLTALKKEFIKKGLKIQVFVGGSYAKGTILKKNDYDIDIYVRFDWRYDDLAALLEGPIKNVSKQLDLKLEKLHGSRDYFRCYVKNGGHYFEVIPVTKINKPNEERNVTDLSYFHVPYVRTRILGLEDDVRLAKTFLFANDIYGAESYIQGFSGYAVECLIIYYKSFLKMIRELSKVKIGERVVIDIEKFYKRKNDVFFEMNENKLHGPIILVDPTNKDRNALASLSQDTFKKFQSAALDFLKNPSDQHFVVKKIDEKNLSLNAKKKGAELLKLEISTNKQSGDIAGTKLKKFFKFLTREIGNYFKVIGSEFYYLQGKSANCYLTVKSRKEVIRIGPPLHLKKFVRKFKAEHRDTYEKNKYIHARMPIKFSSSKYLDVWIKENKKLLKEMSITNIKIN